MENIENELPEGYISLHEASRKLGKSDKTIKNYIKGGKIEGKMITCPVRRISKYIVKEDSLKEFQDTAASIHEVVAIKSEVSLEKFGKEFLTFLENRDEQVKEMMKEHISAEMQKMKNEILEEQAKKTDLLIHEFRKRNEESQQKPSFWERFFKK